MTIVLKNINKIMNRSKKLLLKKLNLLLFSQKIIYVYLDFII